MNDQQQQSAQATELVQRAMERFSNYEALKKEHGPLTVMACGDKMALFKNPSRKVIGVASSYLATNLVKYTEEIANNCFVEGDRELIDEDEYFLSILPELQSLGERKSVEVAKL